jgi:hypothetical protein
MDDYYCPDCEWGPLQEGELRDGDVVYQWQYCDECGWQSEVTRYQVRRVEWGTVLKIDPTIVSPDVALFRSLRGRLQLTTEAPKKPLASGSSEFPCLPSARCPHCGAVIQQHHELCQDLSGYYASWCCEVCGFQSEAIKNPGPGVFTHSEEYRRISWRGKRYEPTRNQRVFIKKLHLQYLIGAPDVHQDELLKEIGQPSSRVRDSFRSANRELWGTLIIHALVRGAAPSESVSSFNGEVPQFDLPNLIFHRCCTCRCKYPVTTPHRPVCLY